jgi:general stress protein 26
MGDVEADYWPRAEELIREIEIALLTTLDEAGNLHARPIQTLHVEGREALWFFTDWGSPKVDEVIHDLRVGLTYTDAAKHHYVAVAGTGRIFRDAAKARELWRMEQRAFYPEGPEDARLALLRVSIERAEYWIAPNGASYLVAALKAALTGAPAGVIGENQKCERR